MLYLSLNVDDTRWFLYFLYCFIAIHTEQFVVFIVVCGISSK